MVGEFPNRAVITSGQFAQLTRLLLAILPDNPFYTQKFSVAKVTAEIESLADFSARFPFTTKAEIVADQLANPPYGTNLTFPIYQYTRCHQTSGSTGVPLRWLDTRESWQWMLDSWEVVHRAAGVAHSDTVFFAFSFGPFLGFWTAFESAERLGCLCLSGGGMNSVARLHTILDQCVTVLCCTPSYALHLAEVAARERLDLRHSKVRLINVAGEPGGSVPALRRQIEAAWPCAQVRDHHGMTEVGPVTYECPARPGVLHVIESAYFAEVIDPMTTLPSAPGQPGELVLTTLARTGSPLLRYRTGDWVKPSGHPAHTCACGRHELALEGGILGRVDDMVVIRGVNVFPSAVEEIIRSSGGIVEYRVHVNRTRALAELSLEIEPATDCLDTAALVRRLEHAFENAFTLRVPITIAAPGALPRFEMKAQRWIKE